MKMVEYTLDELRTVKSSIENYLKELRKETHSVENTIRELSQILNNKRNLHSTIILPEEFLMIKEAIIGDKLSIEWKKLTYEIVKRSDRFLTSVMIYEKARIYHPHQIKDRRYAIKCISSSLVSLVSEGKIGKFKNETGPYFFGEASKHFRDDGKPDPACFPATFRTDM
ncbi:hypothetical protein [Puia dinghuensis]|uniref:Uncharacterized protein n=1 Tax=Puia dinghuensis TaxID=1792502 RepID=A0A8J2UAJ4_9BACT|nr:hypothetical protein [Puia dinghuensis]GGA89364.1 hypothetical protein GCM10011511_10720 [Puia dinghuensis]